MALWTYEHAATLLPSFAVMILTALFLRHFLKEKSDSARILPLRFVSIFLVAIEIGKQIVSFCNGYSLYHLPFHFCSLFIFALPVMSFYRGKHCRTVRGIVSAISASMSILLLIYPNLIYSAGNIREFFQEYISFHTVLFHNLVLFAFVLILALDLHPAQEKSAWKAVMVFTVCFCAVSATMAQLLQTNYNNFYSCNIPPLETLRISAQNTLGYGLTQGIYIVIVTILNILFVQISYRIYRLLHSAIDKKQLLQPKFLHRPETKIS